jgi:L-rhamnose mutarotase
MQRHLQLVNVKPEKRDEYMLLHHAVWPEVETRILASHIENYSIFIRDHLLIAYFEYTGDDYAADQSAIAADSVTQEWWKLTDPCQESVAAGSTTWVDAQEVWHLP